MRILLRNTFTPGFIKLWFKDVYNKYVY
jgi:hypothetical protein